MAARIAIVLIALAGVFWAGVQYERASNLEAVIEAQELAAELQGEINRLVNKANVDALKAREAERERIRQIDTATAGLQRAKKRLAECARRAESERAGQPVGGSSQVGARDAGARDGQDRGGDFAGFSLFAPAALERVWNESREADLPDQGDSAGAGQEVLPTPADGDGVNEAVKLCVTRYNQCAIDYNTLRIFIAE